MSARPVRFICPHCHTPIDPARMETAINGRTEYRICPECDEAILFARSELPISDQGAAPPVLGTQVLDASRPEVEPGTNEVAQGYMELFE